jgi:Mg-chelatase subunit ChlD
VAVYSFQEAGPTEEADFTNNVEVLKEAVRSLKGRTGGGTPLYASLRAAIDRLASEPEGPRRAVVCFTDGLGEDPFLHEQVQQRAEEANVQLNFITLGGGDADWTPYRDLAAATGGQVISVDAASALATAFSQMARIVVADQSYYRLTVQAQRQGRFQDGEKLTVTFQPTGARKTSTYSVQVDLSASPSP